MRHRPRQAVIRLPEGDQCCRRPGRTSGAKFHRGMAQPGSASVWGTEGRRFKSCYPDQHLGVAQPGRVPRSECGGRRFKSCHPDQQRPDRISDPPNGPPSLGCNELRSASASAVHASKAGARSEEYRTSSSGVERRPEEPEVVGSIPTSCTRIQRICAYRGRPPGKSGRRILFNAGVVE